MTTPASSPRPTPDRPRARPGAIVAIAVLGVAAIAGGVWSVSVLSRQGAAQGEAPSETPTREQFVARAGEAIRNSSWREAEAVLREAIAIYDRDQDLRLQLADVLRTRASAASWQRDGAQPTGSGALDPVAQARQDEADARARLDDSLDAYEQMSIALEIGPRTPEIEFRAGLLASESRQDARAIEHFQAARAAAPDNAEYALYLGQAQLRVRDTAAAKASLLACVNIDPENAIAWGTLADQALQENKADMALQHIAHARTLQPDVTLWRLVEARALKRKGDAEGALLVLTALPAPEQRDGPVLTLIAECYAFLGRPGDAADRYGAASDARPTDSALALDAARWYQRVENMERARLYAQRASMLGNAEARVLVDELDG